MKKLLTTIFCFSILFTGTQVMGQETNKEEKQNTTEITTPEKRGPQHFQKRKYQKPPRFNLDEELNLTEEQKLKAKENRILGRKEMKPVMDEIRNKKEAILDIIDSNLDKEKQKAQIETIQKEIKSLYKKANTIREKNMKNFEKILTKEQKTKFEQLKQERFSKKYCRNCNKKMQPPAFEQDEK